MRKGLLAIALATIGAYFWVDLLHLPHWLIGPAIGLLAWGLIEEWA